MFSVEMFRFCTSILSIFAKIDKIEKKNDGVHNYFFVKFELC